MNLLDSPFDINLPVSTSANIPAPPIPPNPEKDALLSALSQTITQTLHDDMSQNAASLPLLRSQNEALNNSLHTLESELAQLQVIQSTLTGNVSILQNSLRDADKCISSAHARAQRGEIPKIDDMLTAPTVVGKQLYDVVCDERGIEAAIWALQAALTRGRITMDVWAKKTRELSREGFKRKVLSRKIGKGMGLEE
jgi:ESCRT-I complex subunit TSG101